MLYVISSQQLHDLIDRTCRLFDDERDLFTAQAVKDHIEGVYNRITTLFQDGPSVGLVIPTEEPILIMNEQHLRCMLEYYAECLTEGDSGEDCIDTVAEFVMDDATMNAESEEGGPWLIR